MANPLIAKHGTTILHGLDRAVKNMDDIKGAYAELSVLHSEKLHVDPDNFRVKIYGTVLTIIIHNQKSFLHVINVFFLWTCVAAAG